MGSDAELIQLVDGAVAEAMANGGDAIACRPGCSHCCVGPFAVTERDLTRLRLGVTTLPEAERERLAARSAEVRETMREGFPGEWATGMIESQQAADIFDSQHPWLPCPILDLETNRCALHAWRPVACRLHGPALRIDGFVLQHCRLNYSGLTADEIDRLRVGFATPETEASPLTYIAWAVPGNSNGH